MIQVKDTRGKSLHLAEPVGKGGQATVYRIDGQPGQLAKIFHQPDASTENKLAWMIGNPPDDPAARIGHASIAWPARLLYREGKFSGYAMPYIRDAVALLTVFNPRLRLRTFPNFNEHYQHNTARNLSSALGALHARGYIVGDLNESNVMVTPATLITMIDTDSFQVRALTKSGQTIRYPCPVGKFEYLPPELQGVSLSGVDRQPEHDRFALAVLIFQLLMDGSHPFRARWRGKGDAPSIQERIKEGLFPYRDPPPANIQPPFSLDILHPMLVELMKRCFIIGHHAPRLRPTAEDWEAALEQADRELVPCGKGHFHGRHLNRCPACARLEQLGPTRARTPQRPLPTSTGPRAPSGNQPPPRPTPVLPVPVIPIPAPVVASGPVSVPIPASIPHRPVPWMLGLGGLGTVLGGLAGWYYPGAPVGGIVGVIGGLVSGALMSETIQKRPFSWEVLGGLTGAAVGAALIPEWQTGAAMFGGLTGILFGRGIRMMQNAHLLLGSLAGAGTGWLLGGAVAGLSEVGWISGALAGLAIGVITGVFGLAWERFS